MNDYTKIASEAVSTALHAHLNPGSVGMEQRHVHALMDQVVSGEETPTINRLAQYLDAEFNLHPALAINVAHTIRAALLAVEAFKAYAEEVVREVNTHYECEDALEALSDRLGLDPLPKPCPTCGRSN